MILQAFFFLNFLNFTITRTVFKVTWIVIFQNIPNGTIYSIFVAPWTWVIVHNECLLENNIEQENVQNRSLIYKILKNKLHLS